MSVNEIICDDCGRIREQSERGPCAGCGGRTFSTAKNKEDPSCSNERISNEQFNLLISDIRSNTEAIREFSVSVHCLAESIIALVDDVLNSKYPDDKQESITNYLNGKPLNDD